MRKYIFISGRVAAFLIETGKEPRYLSALFVNEVDIGERQITVYGLLPDNLHLAKFSNGAQVDFTYQEAGELSRYESREVFLRLNNCRLTRCWIPNLIPQYREQQEALEIWAVIEGDIEVLDENH